MRQIFFAYFLPNLPNLPNKKFSGIFFGDFFIFFPPFAARRRLKCKIFTVSRARVVKKFNGRKFYENKFFSGANWQILASLKCRKYFFSDMQCVFFLVGRGFSVSSSAQGVIRFRRCAVCHPFPQALRGGYPFPQARRALFLGSLFSLVSEKISLLKIFSDTKKNKGALKNAPLRQVAEPTLPTAQRIRSESGALKCRFPPLCARPTSLREALAISSRPY